MGAMAAVETGEPVEEVRRESTREQILEAARKSLIQVGYEHITTRRIAEAAGVNIATLHYYFGTKEALLSEAIQFALNKGEERIRGAIVGVPDAAFALERTFDVIWEMVKERPGLLRFDLAVRGLRDATAKQQVLDIYATFRRLVEEILQGHVASGGQFADGTTAEQLAYFIVATVDGAVLHHILHEDEEATRQSLHLILTHVKSLLLSPARSGENGT